MRGAGLRIGRIFGIPIYLHTSWFLIFALITYEFGSGLADAQWSASQRWEFGLLASALFFGSVLFHELSHSVVAKHYKLPVASITLFFFGGIARITREPDRPGQEFLIAGAGPFSSCVLAGAFWLLARATPDGTMLNGAGEYLWPVNILLAAFNLLPGFPMDGGRLFRSVIWGITKNYNRSTRLAARSGQVIAYGMIGVGVWLAMRAYSSGGDVVNGIWLVLIGWFLLTAARQSYAQVAARGALEGLHASDLMTADMQTVGRDLSLEEYAHEVTNTGRRAHLVVADGQLVGLMTVEALQAVPREEWPMTSVQAAMLSRERVQWATPEEPALDLLERMRRAQVDQMAVVTGGNVIGLITRDSILRVVQAREHPGH